MDPRDDLQTVSAFPYSLQMWLALMVIIVGFLLLVWAIQRAIAMVDEPMGHWRQLEGVSTTVYYLPAPYIDARKLARCVGLAVDLIRETGVWDSGRVTHALTGARLYVDPAAGAAGGAVSLHDVSVGLIRPPADLCVDKEYSTLCHELAHLLENRLDHAIDREHTRWTRRGLGRADAAYKRARLSSRS